MLRKIFLLFALVLVGAFLSACGTNPTVIQHQATAKATAAKWQAKADIAKWKAVQELAKSGTDVGRTAAGMTLQADAIQSGGSKGAASTAAGGYTQDPNFFDMLLGASRELRGWASLKFGRDVALDDNRTQREMRANDNATYLGFGQEIGSTGRYGIDSASSLGSAAIQKIPSYTLPAPGSTATTEPAATTP
jgi:hypothetical protein